MGGNFAGDIFQLLLAIGAVALVLYLFYLFSKIMAKKVNSVAKTNNIQVIEKVALTQDKGLVIAKVGGQYCLIGYATNSISILKELDEADLNLEKSPNPLDKNTFYEIFNKQIKSRMDLIIGDKLRHKEGKDAESISFTADGEDAEGNDGDTASGKEKKDL